jgi:hypothetical protein
VLLAGPSWLGQPGSAPASPQMPSTVSAPNAQQRAEDGGRWRYAVNPLKAGCSRLATMAAIMLASCGAQGQHIVTSGRPLPRFAVFASRTGDDELPSEVATALAHIQRTKFSNADIDDARRVLASQPVWLVPASEDKVCIVRITYPLAGATQETGMAPAIGRTCNSEGEAQAGLLVETRTLGPSPSGWSRMSVIGIAPDGVADVTITARNGLATTAPVQRNAYEAVVAGPVSVIFRTHHDHRAERHVIPLGSVPDNIGAPYVGRSSPRSAG